jgi:acyl phosphate:glycerol-3-phosphate acyltransferase
MNSSAQIAWTGAFVCTALGYLLGSMPFGLIVTRFAGLGDVRKIGSGNIGATNVLRTGKKWAAALTFMLDCGKGAAAVLVAHTYYGIEGGVIAGIAGVLGHIFPVWLRFKGGKGVATFVGVMLAAYWPTGVLVIATWLAVAYFSRISSLSALVAAALAPAYTIAFGRLSESLLALLLAVVIFITHHENVHRLWRGEEPRIGSGKDGG